MDEKIDQQLYQRTAISRKPEEVIRQELEEAKTSNQLLPDMVFRSSYILDMLGLPNSFSERDLMLDKESPIKVAQYYTKLPDKKLLAEKFKKAIAIAKENYQEKKQLMTE